MPILYLHDKIYDTLKRHELNKFLKVCDSKGLSYLQIDECSWQLLPNLIKNTIIIYPLMTNPVLECFIYKLKEQLAQYGATVIMESNLKLNADLLITVNAQAAISFAENTSTLNTTNDMSFYYSLRARESSLGFIGGLVKLMNNKQIDLTYDIASYWKHLTAYKYRKVISSPMPTTLIDFNNTLISEFSLNDLADCLIENIINLYGIKTTSAELDTLAECLRSTKGDKTAPTQKIKPTKLHSSLKRTPAISQKKRRYGKFSSVSPPTDVPVNYFAYSERPETVPQYFHNIPNTNNIPSQTITKSTFNRTVSSSKEQKTDDLPPQKIEQKVSRERNTLQSFKDLKKILEK